MDRPAPGAYDIKATSLGMHIPLVFDFVRFALIDLKPHGLSMVINFEIFIDRIQKPLG